MGDLGSSARSTSNSGTQSSVQNEQVGASDNAVALRGDSNVIAGSGGFVVMPSGDINYTGGVPVDVLERLAGGAGEVVREVVQSNANAGTNFAAALKDLAADKITDGGASLQKTVLIGLAVGGGVLALLTLRKR